MASWPTAQGQGHGGHPGQIAAQPVVVADDTDLSRARSSDQRGPDNRTEIYLWAGMEGEPASEEDRGQCLIYDLCEPWGVQVN